MIVDFYLAKDTPILELKMNDLPVKALIDTGASSIVVSNELSKKLCLNPVGRAESYSVSGKFQVEFSTCSIQIGGVVFGSYEVAITDLSHITGVVGETIDVIIGSSFLIEKKALINYNLLEIEFIL